MIPVKPLYLEMWHDGIMVKRERITTGGGNNATEIQHYYQRRAAEMRQDYLRQLKYEPVFIVSGLQSKMNAIGFVVMPEKTKKAA